MAIKITREQAIADLEKMGAKFDTMGQGTDTDRIAQLVMQPIGVLEGRLGKKEIIKMLYVDNPQASKILTQTVYETAQQYVNGSIDEVEARERLRDAQNQYGNIFREMGISPQASRFLIFKE